MMSQASVIADMPAILYPKLIIICTFFPVLFISIIYFLTQYFFKKNISDYIFNIVPSGIFTYFLYIFIDKLLYSKYSINSLDIKGFYKYLFCILILIIFSVIYIFNHKNINSKSNKLSTIITKYFFFTISIISIFIILYNILFQENTTLKINKLDNFNPKNILIITIDGVNNDKMSVYNTNANTTPFLSSIKSEFMIANNFYTNNCCTFGSITSIYNSKLPLKTHVIFPGSHLNGKDKYEHLPGILKKVGYRTIQVTVPFFADQNVIGMVNAFDDSNYERFSYIHNYIRSMVFESYIYEKLGIFNVIFKDDFLSRIKYFLFNFNYINPFKVITKNINQSPQQIKEDSATKIAVAAKEEPIAVPPHNLFVNPTTKANSDPYSDENKTNYVLGLLENKSSSTPFFIHLHFMSTHTTNPKLYENGLRESDFHIQKIFSILKKKNLLDQTLVMISSDHNQGWVTLKPIPLLVRFPNLEHAGEHIDKNTQIIDLAPTILDYIGIEKPSYMEGYSLLKMNLISENRPIFSVNELDQRNGLLFSSKNNYGIKQVKIQQCDKYNLYDIDDSGKSIKTTEFSGLSSTPSCQNNKNNLKFTFPAEVHL